MPKSDRNSWSETTNWGRGTAVGSMGGDIGRSNTLDPRKRTAPPAPSGRKNKSKHNKARSSVTPW